MTAADKPAPPGSAAAIAAGCACAASSNQNGEGRVVDGVREWTIANNCPVHRDPKWWYGRRKSSI